MYNRSKTPVRDNLDSTTVDPVTEHDTIDPILAQLVTTATMHLPGGGGTWRIGEKLTRTDVADALDIMINFSRTWATRALAAERERDTLIEDRAAVRRLLGIES